MCCARLPDVLVVIFVLRNHSHLGSGQETRVETDSKLSDQIQVPSFDGLNEVRGSRLCDGSQVVDEVVLGHAAATVLNGDGLGVCVVLNSDSEFGEVLKHIGVRDGLEPYFIQRVGGVRDQLPEEDLLLCV